MYFDNDGRRRVFQMIETGNFVQLKEYLNQSRSNAEPQDEVGVTVGGPGSNSY